MKFFRDGEVIKNALSIGVDIVFFGVLKKNNFLKCYVIFNF